MSDIFYDLRSKKDDYDDDSSSATDSFVDSFVGMIGGSTDNMKIPNGGYPPITICQDKNQSNSSEKKSIKDLKKREFSIKNDEKLSVHQILDDRKKKPIFEL